MRKILLAIITIATIASCHSNDKGDEERAAYVAREYYQLLLDGKYNDFVSGMLNADSCSERYREQLVENAAMYAGQQQKEHNGIKAIEVIRCINDTANHSAQAFLSLAYGDSTKEEIVVPMIEKAGTWYMK